MMIHELYTTSLARNSKQAEYVEVQQLLTSVQFRHSRRPSVQAEPEQLAVKL
jgi:hypothetical protein